MTERKNNIFLISAPSGAGKSTLIQLLLNQIPSLFFSISHTTRPPRAGETNGVEYYFVDPPKFRQMIENQQFLEWAEVHGYYYGTSLDMAERAEEETKDLLLDVYIQGAARARELLKPLTTIFILPPSYEVLKQRLLHRQKDTAQQIEQRIENARREISHYTEYDFVVVNEDLGSAFEILAGIIRSQRSRREVMEEKIAQILRSFQPG